MDSPKKKKKKKKKIFPSCKSFSSTVIAYIHTPKEDEMLQDLTEILMLLYEKTIIFVRNCTIPGHQN